jgi:hypothetical protein
MTSLSSGKTTELKLTSPLDHQEPRFWYKAEGTTPDGFPGRWEGGFSCINLAAAVNVAKIRSLKWAAKEIHCIHIYEVDEDGVTDENPSMTFYYREGLPRPQPQTDMWKDAVPLLPAPDENLTECEDKSSAMEFYEKMWKTSIPLNYPTVTHKETSK